MHALLALELALAVLPLRRPQSGSLQPDARSSLSTFALISGPALDRGALCGKVCLSGKLCGPADLDGRLATVHCNDGSMNCRGRPVRRVRLPFERVTIGQHACGGSVPLAAVKCVLGFLRSFQAGQTGEWRTFCAHLRSCSPRLTSRVIPVGDEMESRFQEAAPVCLSDPNVISVGAFARSHSGRSSHSV
jgi:hypothetical protein